MLQVMTKPSPCPLLILSALFPIALVACGSEKETPSEPSDSFTPEVTEVQVSPSSVEFTAVNDSQDFDAEARDQRGNSMSGVDFDWHATDTALVTVDSTGMATAEDEGTAEVVAGASGVADSAEVTVDLSESTPSLPASVGQALPGRYYASTVWDPVNDRVLIFGGYDGRQKDDLFAYDPSTGNWSRLNEGPSLRSHSAVFDSATGHMLVFGGNSGEPQTYSMQNDLWSYDVRSGTWEKLSPSGPIPHEREHHSAVFAPERREMIVFGGMIENKDDNKNDLWVYHADDNRWEQKDPSGGLPPERRMHTATWDRQNQKMYVFGGKDDPNPAYQDFWVYDAEANEWRELSAGGGPPSRFRHSADWAPHEQAMYLTAGCCAIDGKFNDLWRYEPQSDNWTKLTPSGDLPPGRDKFQGQAVWDPHHRSFMVFSGVGPCVIQTDLWAYVPRENRWLRLSPNPNHQPARRAQHEAAVVDGQIFTFGGCSGGRPDNKLLMLDPETGSVEVLSPGGETPPARKRHHLAAAPSRGEIFLFGGTVESEDTKATSDLWKYDVTANEWTQLDPSGSTPERRQKATWIWNPENGQFLLFGGLNPGASGGREEAYLDDLWAYDPAENEWIQVESKQDGRGPDPRSKHSATWDGEQGRMLIYGGNFQSDDGTKREYKDVWSYRPASGEWTRLHDGSGGPIHRVRTQVVWDTHTNRMLLFGGWKFPHLPGPKIEDDLWAYDPASDAWTELAADTPPQVRMEHVFVGVPGSDVAVTFGGYGGSEGKYLEDAWRFDLADQSWIQVR